MEDTRSIFIATDELHTSPLIQNYARIFDVSLTLGQTTLLSFVFSFRGDDEQLRKSLIHYNADLLDILYASVYQNKSGYSATLTLSIEPKDIGITSITISANGNAETSPSTETYAPHLIKNNPIS